MPDRIEIRNPSPIADIRVQTQNELQTTNDNNETTVSWGSPQPDSCVTPMNIAHVPIYVKRRLVLETSSQDDLLLGLSNPSLTNTIKILVHSKKGGSTPLGFIAPTRNGIPADGLNVTLNSKQSVIVQMMPQ
jgi:hypothetical protein